MYHSEFLYYNHLLRKYTNTSLETRPHGRREKWPGIHCLHMHKNPHGVSYTTIDEQKRKKQREDAVQKGFFTDFHVGFQRCESLTGREVEQSSLFGSSSPRSSESNEHNQLVETQQSSIISLSSGFGEDLSGDDSVLETQQQGNAEVINSTSTQPSIETLQNEQITGCMRS